MRVVCAAKMEHPQNRPDAGFAALCQRLKQLQRLARSPCASIYTPTAVRNRCDRFGIAALLYN
jgi:hypothetical protein